MLNLFTVLMISIWISSTHGDNHCWCSTTSNLNIRSSPCGTKTGQIGTGECYAKLGGIETCVLSGTTYTFLEFSVNGVSQWAASNYLQEGSTCEAISTCLCATSNVNIRDAPCGNKLTTIGQGSCNAKMSGSVSCVLYGTQYTFLQFSYNGGSAWAASNYLEEQTCLNVEQGNCDNINWLSRSQWGARSAVSTSPLTTPVSTVFVHHTTSSQCFNQQDCITQVRGIQSYHIDSRGWADIGYNFLVGDDGQAYEGRGWSVRGAHTGASCNGKSVAVSLIGNFDTLQPSETIMSALRNIIDCGIKQGKIYPWATVNILGHKDVCSTACPGQQVYNQIKTWPWYGRNKNICTC